RRSKQLHSLRLSAHRLRVPRSRRRSRPFALTFSSPTRGSRSGDSDPATSSTPFSTKSEPVRVDFLFTERGQPVRGLGPADFEILDNGVLQQVDLVSFEQIPLNVILALDMSESVAGERLEHLRSASQALLNGLKKEDQAALVTFRHDVTLEADLSADPPKVRAALDHADPAGETALVDGAYAAM